MDSRFVAFLGGLVALWLSACTQGSASPDPEQVLDSDTHSFRIESVTEGLEHPWALTFLPNGDALVTERPGRLSRVDLASGERTQIGGVPEVAARGQGGLLDVALHPEFSENRWVYLTYAAAGEGGYATHVGRGRLQENELQEFTVLHVATPFHTTTQHFGSRMVFDEEGYLYVTVGDRGRRDLAQQLTNHQGSVLRLTDTGDIPPDNPFVGMGDAAEPAIFSYGHRNPQGMALHPETGRLWLHEHGPRGGDEINLPQAGENFGWPETSYGTEYGTGRPIGPDPHDADGMVPPIYWWSDSFAPSGMAFYDGDAFPGWQGNLFIGALAKRQLARLTLDGETVVSEETLLAQKNWRIRDVRNGPDGYLYLLVDAADAPLLRLVPAE